MAVNSAFPSFSPLIQQILFGGGIGGANTPPFLPVGSGSTPPPIAPPSKTPNAKTGFFGKADQFLSGDSGQFLMNLLAQSGSSPVPTGGPLAAIGRANLLTRQQKQEEGMTDLQRRLIESQIGVNTARASGAGTTTPTDDMREYQAAVAGGYMGSFLEYMKEIRGAGATSVNIKSEGTIPTGFRAVRDDQGNLIRYEPVPGGPAAQEAEAAAKAEESRTEDQTRKADIVLDEIGRSFKLLDSPSLPETGVAGTLLKDVPGTDAHALANTLQTIKANIGFDRLQAMREASPTGGALGNVTVQEIQRLEAVLGSLLQSQRKEDLEYNLARLNNLYLDTVHGEGKGPKRMPLTRKAPQSEPEQPKRFVYDPATGQLVPK